MAVIYVKEQGAYIKKRGNRIVVTKDDETLLEHPIIHVESLVLFGNIQVSSQTMHLLFENGIDLTFLTSKGRYIGHARSESSKNIFLRMAQFDKYKDKEFRNGISRAFVSGKIRNQINLIRKFNWGSEIETWKEAVQKMENFSDSLGAKKDIGEIMGIEGICSGIYFKYFGKIIKNDFEFAKRVRRPATDPVNALLNLGYTFLNNEISALLEAHSFETYLGFMHGIRYGRKSLALDMMEQFRQPLVDRLVICLLNKKIIQESDFEEEGDRGIYLTKQGFSVFCRQYEEYLNRPAENVGSSYREIMKRQVMCLRDTIMNGKDYEPFVMEL